MKKFILFVVLIFIFVACDSHASDCERVGKKKGWDETALEICKRNPEISRFPEDMW